MAELITLVSQKNSNEGVWTQAVVYGEKQPFDILIYGDDSDVVQKFNRNKLRKLNIGANSKKGLSDETLDELLESEEENVVIRIGGLRSRDKEPLTLDGKELTNDKASYRTLIKAIPDLKHFILEFSNERTNFLSNGKEN